MSNRRIAIFAQTLNFGGSTRTLLSLARGFIERGYEVDLLFTTATGKMENQIPEGANVIDFGSKRTLHVVPKISKYLRERKPAILYCQVTHTGLVALIAQKLALSKTKVVLTVQNTESQASQELPKMKRFIVFNLARIMMPMLSKIIVVSKGVGDDLIAELGIPEDKIRVIYNPVPTHILKENMNKPVDHPWLVNKDKSVVITAARLIPQKDLTTLVKAFHLALAEIDARLIIMGEGGEKKILVELIQELKIEEYVDFPGYADNPFAYMKQADLYVLSSLFEGFGVVLVEAMACGCPVISTDCPSGPSEILEGGEYGKLVPVGDFAALAKAILQSLSEEHDIAKIQERAEYFSEDRIVDEYLSLLPSS